MNDTQQHFRRTDREPCPREMRIGALFEQFPLSVQILSPDGRTLQVNRAWEALFGMTLDDVRDTNLLEDRQLRDSGVLPLLERGFRGETTVIPPVRFDPARTSTSSQAPARWLQGFVYPVKDEAGAVREVMLVHQDITERRQTEEALRESEERYALAVRGANDGLWDWNVGTGEVYFSPRWKEMLGYAEQEFPNNFGEWEKHLHPDDRERAEQTIRDYFEGRAPAYVLEHRLRHKNGTYRWVLARGTAIRDRDGRPIRMAGSHTDITERKRAEEALRAGTEELRRAHDELEARVAERTAELAGVNAVLQAEIAERARAEEALRRSEEHFRLLIENASDIITILNSDGTIRYHSPSAVRINGYPDEEVIGKSALHFMHPDDLAGVLAVLRNMRENPGTAFTAEFRFRHKDGHWKRFESIGRTLSPTSADEGILVNSRDITERKRAEEELRFQKTLLEAQSEATIDGMLVVSSEGRIISVNRRFVEMWGIPQEVITTHSDEAALQAVQDKLLDPREFLARVAYLYEHPDEESRDEVRLRDGRTFDRYSAPVKGANGAYHGRVWYFRDVTDRKRAEEDVQTARDTAEAANRSKSEFLSRMSHELRTPMNSILGFAQLLGRKPLAADQRKSVEHIIKAGRHLLDLINEVLDIARIEANRLQLSLEPVRVGGVLQEALSLMQPLAAQGGCRIEGTAALLSDEYVLADRQRFLQVLLNLLSNAVKYNRRDSAVFLSCQRVADEAGTSCATGERLQIRVRDTGPGIPPEKLCRLFVPFERLGAEQSAVEGTGLGLALSQRLVEAMGGVLAAESVLEQGSTFVITLALAENPLERLEQSGHPAAARAPEENDVPPEKTATLLYIEDNLANFSLIETILWERPGVQLLSALQGRLGLDLADKHRPDLILLDLHLPDMAGDEVLAHLQSHPATRDIPVVMVSADATPGSVERLLRAGARGYLTKPLDVDQFLETVDGVLEKARG